MPFPNLPGVPSLKGYSGVAAVGTLAARGISNLLNSLKPHWGIYDSTGNNKVLDPDSFLGIEYKTEFNVSNFPVEGGKLASYNKVRLPFNASIRVAKGGKDTDRSSFLQTLESLKVSLDLLTIVTPNATYHNVNLTSFTYKRETNNGASLIIASINLVEIMTATTTQSTNNTTTPPDATATTPNAQASVDNGMCQPNTLATPYTGFI